MNKVVRDFVMTSLTLVALYLVLTRAGGASTLIKSLSGGYVGIVKALQGR